MDKRPLKIHGTLEEVLRVSVTKGVKPAKSRRKKAARKTAKRIGEARLLDRAHLFAMIIGVVL